MKVVLSSRGSRGDVYPIIEIGAALKRAGLNVSICVPEMFGTRALSKGLKPLLYSEDSAMVMEELGSGIGAIKTAIDWFSRAIDEQMDFLIRETEDADLLVTSVNEVAVPTVAEYREIPHYRIAYTPVLPGYHPPPLIPWQRLPRIVNRGLWNAVNAMTGLMFRKHINGARRKLGMADMGGVNEYFTGRSHTILTINPVLAPPCRTWRSNYDYSYTGYCYGDIDGGLGPELAGSLKTARRRSISASAASASTIQRPSPASYWRPLSAPVAAPSWAPAGRDWATWSFPPRSFRWETRTTPPCSASAPAPPITGAAAPHTPPRGPECRSSSCPR